MEQKTEVFEALKRILSSNVSKLTPALDDASNFSLDVPSKEDGEKSEFFAAIQIKKNYVSFHLMPVYYYPDLLKGINPGLKKRMQGKSCFNFTKVDPELMSELSALVQASFMRYKAEKKIK
jgi:hypothetical protein